MFSKQTLAFMLLFQCNFFIEKGIGLSKLQLSHFYFSVIFSQQQGLTIWYDKFIFYRILSKWCWINTKVFIDFTIPSACVQKHSLGFSVQLPYCCQCSKDFKVIDLVVNIMQRYRQTEELTASQYKCLCKVFHNHFCAGKFALTFTFYVSFFYICLSLIFLPSPEFQ